MAQCQFCGADLPFTGRVPREEECPACRRDLHCCRQCVHFDPAVHNQCRETQAEWIVEKERRNFCDYFLLSGRPARRTGPRETPEEKWNRLFGKKK
ncbi:MAG TPA: hypothetical protein VMS93_01745 [Candidatus Saccharimonadales bacterium]|nr:hypothetical protein [Candidatus Saccharimonadales bacterium]